MVLAYGTAASECCVSDFTYNGGSQELTITLNNGDTFTVDATPFIEDIQVAVDGSDAADFLENQIAAGNVSIGIQNNAGTLEVVANISSLAGNLLTLGVDGLQVDPASIPSATASNGLNIDGTSGDVKLGGPLTETTLVTDSGALDLGFTGMNSFSVLGVGAYNVQGLTSATISSPVTTLGATTALSLVTPGVAGATVSAGQVFTLTDPVNGTGEWQDAAAPTTASNGLNIDGTSGDVKLGGVLTEATTIDADDFDFNINPPSAGSNNAFTLYSDTNFFGSGQGGYAAGYGDTTGELYYLTVNNFGSGYQLSNGWFNNATGESHNLIANPTLVQMNAGTTGSNSSVRVYGDGRVMFDSRTGIYEFENEPNTATAFDHVLVIDTTANDYIEKVTPVDLRPAILECDKNGAILVCDGSNFAEATYNEEKVAGVGAGVISLTLINTPAPGFFQLFKDGVLLDNGGAGADGFSIVGSSISLVTPLVGTENIKAFYYSY